MKEISQTLIIKWLVYDHFMREDDLWSFLSSMTIK